MLSGAKADFSIENYEREFAFLGLKNIPGMTYSDSKRRYIFAYYLYKFMIASIFAAFASVICCISIIYSPEAIISAFYGEFSLAAAWPWNQNQELQLEFTGHLSGLDQRRFLVSCGAISVIWMIFVGYNTIVGVFNSNRYSSLNVKALALWLVAALLMWLCSSFDLFTGDSVGPSVVDSLPLLVLKKCLIISFTYWLSGYLIFLSLAKFKYWKSSKPK